MENVLKEMKIAMELKGFAKSTIRTYVPHVLRFATFVGKPLCETDFEDIKAFLYDAIHNRKLSGMYVDSSYSAIKFLFCFVFKRKWTIQDVPRLKRKTFIPQLLTKEEVFAVINATNNLKHKAYLSTAYSAGLRVSEVASLRITDIDSTNMRILVRQGKGGKDRYSILSQNNLEILREYYKAYRPVFWLFNGVPTTEHISIGTLQTTFKEAVRKLGIKKKVSFHTLRHCFATHLLNSGSSILPIKELLGHENIDTTSKYLHLTNAEVLGIKSPFDDGGVR